MNKETRKGTKGQGEKFIFESYDGTLSVRESLLEMLLEEGKISFIKMLDKEVEQLCGERYRHNQERKNTRYGYKHSEVTLGGRRASIRHNRVRDAANESEIELQILKRFKNEDLLNAMRVKQILSGVTTRKYEQSLEVEAPMFKTRGASKSAVSRGFVSMTASRLNAWTNQAIKEDYPLMMIDGLEFKGKTVVVALGIGKDGYKKVLGIREGSTENAKVVTDLLQNLIERGLKREAIKLFTIDGSKALRKAIRDVFGDDILVKRCIAHKKINVLSYLPEEMKSSVSDTMSQAYNASTYEMALKILKNLMNVLEKKCPEAARSLEEGLDETLTLLKLKAPKNISKTLNSTNAIENVNGSIRKTTRNVRRWKGSRMITRWVYVSIVEAEKKFRRIKGFKEIEHLLDLIEMTKNNGRKKAA